MTMRSPTLAPASLMALTSFSGPPPTAWHEPLAVQPSQELEGRALTQVPVVSILVTIPCSVAIRVSFRRRVVVLCLSNNNQQGLGWQGLGLSAQVSARRCQ